MTTVDYIVHLFETKGHAAYLGEPVSQKEHALQTAHHAATIGAPPAVVVAALLHDIGHLVCGLADDIAGQGIDGRHEDAGEAWLGRYFGPSITEPVKLHVAAKRYLCAVDPDYLRQLSPASVRSLQLQGGPFGPDEVAQFEKQPHFRAAVQLRRCDDQAKTPGLAVPGLGHYRAALEEALRSSQAT